MADYPSGQQQPEQQKSHLTQQQRQQQHHFEQTVFRHQQNQYIQQQQHLAAMSKSHAMMMQQQQREQGPSPQQMHAHQQQIQQQIQNNSNQIPTQQMNISQQRQNTSLMQQMPSQTAYPQQNHIRQINSIPQQFPQQHPQQMHQARRISPPTSQQQYSNQQQTYSRPAITVYGNNNGGSNSNTAPPNRSQGPSPLQPQQQNVHLSRSGNVSMGGSQQPQMMYRGMTQQNPQNTPLNTRQPQSQQTHYAYINNNDSNPQIQRISTTPKPMEYANQNQTSYQQTPTLRHVLSQQRNTSSVPIPTTSAIVVSQNQQNLRQQSSTPTIGAGQQSNVVLLSTASQQQGQQQQILTNNGQTYVAASAGTTFMLSDGTRAIATSSNNSNNNQQTTQIHISGQAPQQLQQHQGNQLQPQYIVSTQYQQQIASQQPPQQIVVVAPSPIEPTSLLQQQQQSQQIQLQQMQQSSQSTILRAPPKAKTPPKFVAVTSVNNSNMSATQLKNGPSISVNRSATKSTTSTLSTLNSLKESFSTSTRLVPLPASVISTTDPTQKQPELLSSEALDTLIKSVDEHEILEEGVGKVMLRIVEELTDNFVKGAVALSKHRSSRHVEKRDIQFLLSRQLNAGIPPLSDGKNPLAPQTTNESRFGGPAAKRVAMGPHIQRLNTIEQFGRKM